MSELDLAPEVNNVRRVCYSCDSGIFSPCCLGRAGSFLLPSNNISPIPCPVIAKIGSQKCAILHLYLALSPKHDRGKEFEFHVRHWSLTRSWKCPTVPLPPVCEEANPSADHSQPWANLVVPTPWESTKVLLLGKVGTAGHHRTAPTIPYMRRKSGPCMGTMMSGKYLGNIYPFSI
jgi:hypothetical protein